MVAYFFNNNFSFSFPGSNKKNKHSNYLINVFRFCSSFSTWQSCHCECLLSSCYCFCFLILDISIQIEWMKLFVWQVGFGGVGVDLLATVESFPKPDTKNRTTQFKVHPLPLFPFVCFYYYNEVPFGPININYTSQKSRNSFVKNYNYGTQC